MPAGACCLDSKRQAMCRTKNPEGNFVHRHQNLLTRGRRVRKNGQHLPCSARWRASSHRAEQKPRTHYAGKISVGTSCGGVMGGANLRCHQPERLSPCLARCPMVFHDKASGTFTSNSCHQPLHGVPEKDSFLGDISRHFPM